MNPVYSRRATEHRINGTLERALEISPSAEQIEMQRPNADVAETYLQLASILAGRRANPPVYSTSGLHAHTQTDIALIPFLPINFFYTCSGK